MSQDIRVTEEQNTKRRASILGFNYVDTSTPDKKILYKDILSIQEMYDLKIIPLVVGKSTINFGITTTTSQQTMTKLTNQFLDQRISFSLISDAGFRDYMKLYDPPKEVVYQDISISAGSTENLISSVSGTLDKIKAVDMLAYLTNQAHRLQASDIHLEHQRGFARVRFRIDGVLHSVAKLSPERSRMLTAAVASAANVSTSASDAQQGHITQVVKMADNSEVNVNLRVETVPAINGMDIVMRLFNMDTEMYTLDRLGLSPSERQIVDDIIKKPNGLVMAVGPTGSGKTTTLYSILNTLNTDKVKIITIEDPVEYQFDGVTQIPITTTSGAESHFADKLRAVLRLDPDIVMVGEIRDNDTARTSLQASLTGHLVLATFHAGSAAEALTRLVDIIGQNPLFSSAIRLIMAQRLVRRLDDNTKIAYSPEAPVKAKLQSIIDSLPPNIQRPNLENIQLYKEGSSAENPFGFKGQIALREQLVMSNDLRLLLQKPSIELSSQLIEKTAIDAGMLTMLHSALFQLLNGRTTVEEVFRVLG